MVVRSDNFFSHRFLSSFPSDHPISVPDVCSGMEVSSLSFREQNAPFRIVPAPSIVLRWYFLLILAMASKINKFSDDSDPTAARKGNSFILLKNRGKHKPSAMYWVCAQACLSALVQNGKPSFFAWAG
jgi:hypothetical protein